jgi:hypothetical protein
MWAAEQKFAFFQTRRRDKWEGNRRLLARSLQPRFTSRAPLVSHPLPPWQCGQDRTSTKTKLSRAGRRSQPPRHAIADTPRFEKSARPDCATLYQARPGRLIVGVAGRRLSGGSTE